MLRRALVTGGAGFIGSHLGRRLLAEGLEVVVLDDLSVGSREKVPEGAELVVGDVRSESDVKRALEGVDVVFHEAARVSIRSSVGHFHEDADINLMGTLNLLRGCSAASVRKLVYASSMAVYAEGEAGRPIPESHALEPISPYGISKLAGEKYCLGFARDAGIACHVLRYFNTFGTGQTLTPYVGVITIFVHALLAGEAPTVFGDGEQRRDFVHVSDVVEANLLALASDRPAGVYNVGSGRGTSVNEVAELLRARIAPDVKPRHAEAVPGELRFSVADLTRTTAELGYRPQGSLEDRIDEVIASCAASGPGRAR